MPLDEAYMWLDTSAGVSGGRGLEVFVNRERLMRVRLKRHTVP